MQPAFSDFNHIQSAFPVGVLFAAACDDRNGLRSGKHDALFEPEFGPVGQNIAFFAARNRLFLDQAFLQVRGGTARLIDAVGSEKTDGKVVLVQVLTGLDRKSVV